uniref:Uncharacterized protein n=1 Tax=Anguilla anguilla TaxID=7936 RepID=A0A0E9X435_ANGAN
MTSQDGFRSVIFKCILPFLNQVLKKSVSSHYRLLARNAAPETAILMQKFNILA